MNGRYYDETKPAWYELSMRTSTIIGFAVHRIAFEEISKIDWTASKGCVSYLREQFDLPEFIPPGSGDCGFGGIFKITDSGHPDWILWEFELPKIRRAFESPDGSMKRVMSVRAMLFIFSTSLWLFEGDTSWNEPQLTVIENIQLPSKERSFADGSISVTLTPPMVDWLTRTQKNNTHIVPVIEAMMRADRHMWSGDPDKYYFKALFRSPKWINLCIPGNACGLDPEGYHDDPGKGYTLHPHNVDSSLQQLTLLVGLARLHDMARGKYPPTDAGQFLLDLEK